MGVVLAEHVSDDPRLLDALAGALRAQKRLDEAEAAVRRVLERHPQDAGAFRTLAAVESGAVDAGIVYRTDAAISNKVRVVFVVTNGPAITYSLAKVAPSKSPGAQRFVDFVAGAEGRAVFERRGFKVLK